MVKVNIKVPEIMNDKMAKKNRSLNTILCITLLKDGMLLPLVVSMYV